MPIGICFTLMENHKTKTTQASDLPDHPDDFVPVVVFKAVFTFHCKRRICNIGKSPDKDIGVLDGGFCIDFLIESGTGGFVLEVGCFLFFI